MELNANLLEGNAARLGKGKSEHKSCKITGSEHGGRGRGDKTGTMIWDSIDTIMPFKRASLSFLP